MDSLYKELEPYASVTDYYNETVRSMELANFAMSIARLFNEDGDYDAHTAEVLTKKFFKDYHLPIDKEIFVAMMEAYEKNVPETFKPEYFRLSLSKYGDTQTWADSLFGNTLFTDQEKVKALKAGDREKVKSDSATEFFNEFLKWYHSDIRPHVQRINAELQLAYRDYMRGQMVFSRTARKARAFYPDANLRIAYGHVKGYSPSDGVYYKPNSTMKGIMEKDNPEIFDYNIPQRLRDIYASRDFGRWADESGYVPVCFIATNHR